MDEVGFLDIKMPFHSHSSNRVFISSVIFAFLAGLIKAVFFPSPEWNPPFIFPMLTAFLVTAFFWWLLVGRRYRTNLAWGAIAGAIIGLVTPPLMWLPYGLFLTVTLDKGIEPLAWSPIYAFLMLIRVSPFATLLGAIVGAIIAFVESKKTVT